MLSRTFFDSLQELALDGPIIYLFHGVTNQKRIGLRNYSGKHIMEHEFQQFLRYATENWNPVTVRDVAQHAKKEVSLEPLSFAISFDDGFKNNADVAAPILHDFGIPATFFVTTKFLNSSGQTWIDRIEAAVQATTLSKVVLGRLHGGEFSLSSLSAKEDFMRHVRHLIKNDPQVAVEDFTEHLLKLLKIESPPTDRSLDEKLSSENLLEIAACDLFDIGFHTQTHPILSRLSKEDQQAEILGSKFALERICGRQFDLFAYPEGTEASYNDKTLEILAEYAISAAFTTEPRAVVSGDHIHKIPRYQVA